MRPIRGHVLLSLHRPRACFLGPLGRIAPLHRGNTIWPLFPLTGDLLDLACLFNSFYAFPVQVGALSQARLVIFDFTSAVYSASYDLFPPEKAAELEMRAQLLIGLEQWLEKSRMTQDEAAKVLGVTQARVSDLKRGKIDRFSMDLPVRLAARAGLKPKLKLAA
jgi:predicted XRE-type DNA-binding protein